MKETFEIKQLGRETIKDQLRIYRAAFKVQEDFDKNLVRWTKKHYENPLGDSLVFGAYYDGELVGMNAYMPVEYHYNGETIPMLQSCESGVDPNFQGKGIWSKVVKAALNYIFTQTEYQAVIGFPNYSNSYPGFQKMGWKTLFGMNNYVMVNSSSVFAKMMFSGQKLMQLFGRAIAIQRINTSINNDTFNKYDILECPLNDTIWDDDPNVLSVSHSDALMEWKKSYKNIKTILIKSNKSKVASCIFRLSTYKGTTIIKIEKLVAVDSRPKNLKLIVKLLLNFFAKQYPQVAFIRIWTMPDTTLSKSLKSLLFFKSSHPNPFIIKETNDELSKQSWNLSFFDLD